MIISFHRVVGELTGSDVTIARTKTMVALVSLTWPEKGVIVSCSTTGQGRVFWKSADFDSLSMGGSFRRDPVGDDASLVIDEDEQWDMVMLDEMRECAGFIPLFGRQSLERFNRTLAELFRYRESRAPLPDPGSESAADFSSPEEYGALYGWLQSHGAINSVGEWSVC